MFLHDIILQEHSKKQCDRIVKYVGSDKQRFDELMKLFFSGEYRVVQHAAWPMSYCLQAHPSLLTPYVREMMKRLSSSSQPAAVSRNILRVLQNVDIPRRYHGTLIDACFRFIESSDAAPAIKAFSLSILYRLSELYPDILQELKVVIEERWDHETAAFKSRARKIIANIK